MMTYIDIMESPLEIPIIEKQNGEIFISLESVLNSSYSLQDILLAHGIQHPCILTVHEENIIADDYIQEYTRTLLEHNKDIRVIPVSSKLHACQVCDNLMTAILEDSKLDDEYFGDTIDTEYDKFLRPGSAKAWNANHPNDIIPDDNMEEYMKKEVFPKLAKKNPIDFGIYSSKDSFKRGYRDRSARFAIRSVLDKETLKNTKFDNILQKAWAYLKHHIHLSRDQIAQIIGRLNVYMRELIDKTSGKSTKDMTYWERIKEFVFRLIELLSRKLHNLIQYNSGKIRDTHEKLTVNPLMQTAIASEFELANRFGIPITPEMFAHVMDKHNVRVEKTKYGIFDRQQKTSDAYRLPPDISGSETLHNSKNTRTEENIPVYQNDGNTSQKRLLLPQYT